MDSLSASEADIVVIAFHVPHPNLRFLPRRRVHHESSVYVTTSSSWSRSILFCKIYLLTLVGYAVIDPRVEQQRIYLGTKIVSASFMPWHEFRGM